MIVITGGTGALGKELVKLYKADKKTVVSIARHENPKADHNLLHDLSEPQEVVVAAQEIEKIEEPVEAIINAAGMYGPVSLGELTEVEVKRNMAIHAETPMLLVSNLLERIKRDGADIVNVSSIAAVRHSAGAPAYSVSKAALRGFSADLQEALKKYPSRVISFCPSTFDDNSPTSPRDVAKLLKQLLDLPKSMEVAEIIINTKGVA
jgi:NAD(P)-dependent dehydrogenase (short-subunit alcohol dehydrogenase family)